MMDFQFSQTKKDLSKIKKCTVHFAVFCRPFYFPKYVSVFLSVLQTFSQIRSVAQLARG